jgi:hypothetical protein
MPYRNYIELVDTIIKSTWKELEAYGFDDLDDVKKATDYLLERTKSLCDET